MDYDFGKSSATPYEYVVDKRESVYAVKQPALQYVNVMFHGWCSMQKADFLLDLVLQTKPQKIVEIGVWAGKSLIDMAYGLKANQSGIIYGIDPWDKEASIQGVEEKGSQLFWQQVDHGEIYRILVSQLEECNLTSYVQLIAETSEDAPPIYDIDILHVDGNHSEETSMIDVTKWVPLMKKGGIIVFDDMAWVESSYFTTQKAVEWLDEHCFKLAEFTDISIWGVWIKI